MKIILPVVTFFLGAAITLYVVVLGGFLPEKHYTRINISNQSAEKITYLEIKYSAGSAVIKDIQKSESKTIILSSSTEGAFIINVKFESGHELKGPEEYYTSGFTVSKRITKERITDEN